MTKLEESKLIERIERLVKELKQAANELDKMGEK